ncbi:MAG TPA: 3'-5' exoribonuclease [Ktedonobacteraceae bacterium]|jgi:hypothetical protein|nr:3'-5' exoribonuclease [Ktedonobacteraceae bacterium]
MKYFLDTEFIEDGKTIDLISIGIACEDGRELYLQHCDFNAREANEWVKENVLPHLATCQNGFGHERRTLEYDLSIHADTGQCVSIPGYRPNLSLCPWRTRAQIRDEIKLFFFAHMSTNPNDGIELYGYYSAYDHVAFCQLFGTMADLPKGYPMYTRDLKQWCDDLGNPELPKQEGTEHNALADARWNKSVYDFLMVAKGNRQWQE